MIAQAASGHFIRYVISETWPARRPVLDEEQWSLGAKTARKHMGDAGYSVHSHAEFERRAVTPEGALEVYIAQQRASVERLEEQLTEARGRLAVATAIVIVDGKLVL